MRALPGPSTRPPIFIYPNRYLIILSPRFSGANSGSGPPGLLVTARNPTSLRWVRPIGRYLCIRNRKGWRVGRRVGVRKQPRIVLDGKKPAKKGIEMRMRPSGCYSQYRSKKNRKQKRAGRSISMSAQGAIANPPPCTARASVPLWLGLAVAAQADGKIANGRRHGRGCFPFFFVFGILCAVPSSLIGEWGAGCFCCFCCFYPRCNLYVTSIN